MIKNVCHKGNIETTWTSNPQEKRFNGKIMAVFSCIFKVERLLQLFCIFPVTCLKPRGGGGKETDLSTKNTFLRISPVQQGKNLSLGRWPPFLKRQLETGMLQDELLPEFKVVFLNVGNLCMYLIQWFYDLLRIACYHREHNLITEQLPKEYS